MERNTQTTFGALQVGYRFYFVGDSKKTAYQLTKKEYKSSYNIVHQNGKHGWQFCRQAANDRPVIFLRNNSEDK